MKFDKPLREAVLLKRYKRFLADVLLPDGTQTTLHCPNTGAMTGCAVPGSRVWYSLSANSSRKYPGTLEIVEVAQGHLAGINTGLANVLVDEALRCGAVAPLQAYTELRREVPCGEEKSRIDFLLSSHPHRPDELCYVEVKSVTLCLGSGEGAFPDAVTTRGSKHLRELIELRSRGHRAVLFFCVQHTGIDSVRPAFEIDPAYAALLRKARDEGVELLAWRARINPAEIVLETQLPVLVDQQGLRFFPAN